MCQVTMTKTEMPTAAAHPTQVRPSAEVMMREAAFVMAMTQKVKSEMTRPTLRQPSPRLAALVG